MHKSNCLLEALKSFLKNPIQNKIFKKGSWACVLKRYWPHFYWFNVSTGKYYAYCQKDDVALTWMQQLWYEGDIVEYKGHKED